MYATLESGAKCLKIFGVNQLFLKGDSELFTTGLIRLERAARAKGAAERAVRTVWVVRRFRWAARARRVRRNSSTIRGRVLPLCAGTIIIYIYLVKKR